MQEASSAAGRDEVRRLQRGYVFRLLRAMPLAALSIAAIWLLAAFLFAADESGDIDEAVLRHMVSFRRVDAESGASKGDEGCIFVFQGRDYFPVGKCFVRRFKGYSPCVKTGVPDEPYGVYVLVGMRRVGPSEAEVDATVCEMGNKVRVWDTYRVVKQRGQWIVTGIIPVRR